MSNNKQLTPVIFIIVILMSIILCVVIFPTIIAAHAQYPYLPNIQTVRASNNNNNNNNGGTSEPQPKINPFGQLIGVIDGSSDSGKGNKSNGNNSSSLNNSDNKVVILNLYNTIQSQFTNAKPILDKYGFKVSFFIVCNWAGSKPSRLTWPEIEQLHNEGHDIESHTMNNKRLDNLSLSELDYELGQSKQCLSNHGINATIFSPPHSIGWNNATVINAISKYYDLSIGGFTTDSMFLHCYGWTNLGLPVTSQTDCRTYYDNGTLTYANRYDIKERPHNGLDSRFSHNDTKIFEKFVELVSNQLKYNKNDTQLNVIPIIGYHSIDNDKTPDSTDIDLFAAEMKYLHDNGFKVLTMSDLGYDEKSNLLYVKKGLQQQ
jgi:hypothetical protein